MPINTIVFDAYGTLYDTQSVSAITDKAYPGYGDAIAQIWRLKQLEYTWLRSLMRQYEDFASVTRASLNYTLRLLGLPIDMTIFEQIMDKYVHLDLYPDALSALASLQDNQLAILSNGSPSMLTGLVQNSGLSSILAAAISIDEVQTFKPSPQAYGLVEQKLGVPPCDVLFVSSNPFDVCGAKAFGFKVAWIERVSPKAMAAAFRRCETVAPLTMFQALRQQMDELGYAPNFRISALSDLAGVVSSTRTTDSLEQTSSALKI